ncbi:Mitochondrial import inner membrane translocase subunit tim8 [Cladophialophora chaetospira]|uniref:Mitochondrial import inner membrane translocase subunit n=1 Tax=Cladophialophora chaetospira TaxID=386627 RepID=A0AA39CD11_9EURO|nr:Mitochondrial import inner membrane translocase subunit tim8 [Cladophialophora chaetospira]
MDDGEININPEDINRLSDREKRELQIFLQGESQKAQVQKQIHELTEMCFKKCITGSISSGKLTGKEESCMTNCVNRLFDSNLVILKHLEALRQQQ